MNTQFDLVLRGGTIIDGSGAEKFAGDVAILDGRIAAIGIFSGTGIEEIDARGRLVTPGFVDIHTHYDGQVMWETKLRPSSDHGVTTVVMGNCGVGFAPCKPEHHDLLIKLMEGVEDIPEVVMTKGIPWNWESFPEFMEALSQRRCDVDFATQIPHSPLRVYVMGERGANLEAPTDADLSQMTALVKQAVEAGAFGVTTSRAINHRSRDGRLAPSVPSEERELLALAEGLKQAGRGVFQMIPHPLHEASEEFAVARHIAEASGRPLSFSLLEINFVPNGWREYLDALEQAERDGLTMRGQVFPRPTGALLGLDLSFHPFSLNPSFAEIRDLPLAEKVRAMRDPGMRARLLAEKPEDANEFNVYFVSNVEKLYVLSDPPVYNQPAERSLGAMARAKGVSVHELAYDLLLENEGKTLLFFPGANYLKGNLDNVHSMITHPNTVVALGDGGAHYGLICDASYPTYLLTHWARDVEPAHRLRLEDAVAALTRRPAQAIGLTDRGVIRRGAKADLNILDFDRLSLHAPTPVFDLPDGGRRIRQLATGYAVTIVSGIVTYRDGEPTGAMPGRLVRATDMEGVPETSNNFASVA